MRYIANDGTVINFEVESHGPALVLQHGFFGSIQDWYEYKYVEGLRDYYQLVMIDARGHGESDKPRNHKEYHLQVRAADIVDILDQLGIMRCHYPGYSMGGWISFGLIRWLRERIKSYIIVAAHPYASDMSPLREAVATLGSWVPQLTISYNHKERFLRNDNEALLAAIADNRTDNTDMLRSLSVPCLFIAGEKDELMTKAKSAARLSEQCKFTMIPNVDHGETLYRSDLVIEHVLDFLKALE